MSNTSLLHMLQELSSGNEVGRGGGGGGVIVFFALGMGVGS